MVTNTFAPARNGVAAVVGMLRRELEARGHEVDVLTGRLRGRAADERVHETPVVRGFARDFPLPVSLLGVPGSLRGESYDVVHVHHPVLLGPLGRRIAEGCGAAAVFTAHSVYTDYLDSYAGGLARPMKAGVARRTAEFLSGFDLVLAPSTHVRRVMREWGASSRIEMLEAAADVTPRPREEARRRLGVRAEERLALDVGRLAPEKRHDVVVREFAAAAELVPEAELVIVGDGHERARLERLAGELGVRGRVRILGGLDRDELALWYSASDVLVAGSLSETGPLTVVEAMACGVPAVAYDAPGFEDRLTTGDNGILVEPRDGELAAALAAVLGNAEVRGKLSTGARHHAFAYTPARATETLLGYYEELLSSSEES
ncbi:MAG TPA: glycosyltransferase [Coriobacteriia bacterium]|jgi:glycosyltransferase involved in cell wall biosynthesis